MTRTTGNMTPEVQAAINAIQARTDLTAAQKKQEVKKIRRKARRERRKAEAGQSGIARPKRDRTAARAARALRKSGEPNLKPLGSSAEMAAYRASVLAGLEAAGLRHVTWSQVEDEAPPYGFSLPQAYQLEADHSTLLEKFQVRWPESSPQWFITAMQGSSTLVLLGPTRARTL
jgi:hypothetical protein